MRDRLTILAVDTATEACSAALSVDGKIYCRYQLAPREHSRLILKMIDDLLAEAGVSLVHIDAIAFGCGPGSFMGIRIAAGVVQGIAFAHDIPVVCVSTLKAIAHRAYLESSKDHVLTAIDARMDEVYWAAYRRLGERWILDVEEQVISPDRISLPDDLSEPEAEWVAAGTGWQSYADRLLPAQDKSKQVFSPAMILPACFPSAEVIAQLAVDEVREGNTVKAEQAVPVYLRNDVAKKPKPVVL